MFTPAAVQNIKDLLSRCTDEQLYEIFKDIFPAVRECLDKVFPPIDTDQVEKKYQQRQQEPYVFTVPRDCV